MNIFLYGFMGCGKTTVGKILSEKLKYDFLDSDKLISDKIGLSINEIFNKYSEEYFRKLETEVLKEISKSKNTVISLGGGAILREENAEIIECSGTTVFIEIDGKTAFERLKDDSSRPLLNTEDKFNTINQLLEKRNPIYKRYAKLTVKGAENPEKIAENIIDFFKI